MYLVDQFDFTWRIEWNSKLVWPEWGIFVKLFRLYMQPVLTPSNEHGQMKISVGDLKWIHFSWLAVSLKWVCLRCGRKAFLNSSLLSRQMQIHINKKKTQSNILIKWIYCNWSVIYCGEIIENIVEKYLHKKILINKWTVQKYIELFFVL